MVEEWGCVRYRESSVYAKLKDGFVNFYKIINNSFLDIAKYPFLGIAKFGPFNVVAAWHPYTLKECYENIPEQGVLFAIPVTAEEVEQYIYKGEKDDD